MISINRRPAIRRSVAAAAGLAALALLPGCGEDQLPTAPVSGKVTLNDKPLTSGTVIFESEKHGITARGEIQSDGTYTLRTYGGKKSPDGAVLGEHKVAIKAFQEGAASASGDEEPGVGKPAIPEKYLYTYDSGIVKEVTEGPNDIPIKLQGQVPQ